MDGFEITIAFDIEAKTEEEAINKFRLLVESANIGDFTVEKIDD